MKNGKSVMGKTKLWPKNLEFTWKLSERHVRTHGDSNPGNWLRRPVGYPLPHGPILKQKNIKYTIKLSFDVIPYYNYV